MISKFNKWVRIAQVHIVRDRSAVHKGRNRKRWPTSIVICYSILSLPRGIPFTPAPSLNMSFLPGLSSNRSKKAVRKGLPSTIPNNHVNRDSQRERLNRIFEQYRGSSARILETDCRSF